MSGSLSGRMGRHSLIYAASILASQALGFVLIPIYTRVLRPGDYGSLEILNRTSEILGIVILAGMRMAVIRFVQDPLYRERRAEVVGSALWTLVAPAALLLGLLFWQASAVAAFLLHAPQLGWAVRLMAAGSLCELLTILPMALLQADQRSGLFATLSLSRFALGLVLNLLLVAAWKLGLKGVLVATLLSGASMALFLQARLWAREKPRAEGRVLRELLRFGLPFVPGGLFLFVLNNGDRYFLARMTTPAEVGLYALGYRLGSLMLFLLVTPIIMNWSAVMVEIAARPDARQVFRSAVTVVTSLYACAGAAFCLLAPQLLAGLAGPAYAPAWGLVPWVCLAYFFYTCALFFDTPFYLARRTGSKPLILGLACVVNLALYALLIPRYRMYGAAYATVLSFAFFAVLTWAFARRHLDIPYDWIRMVTVLASATAVVAVGLGLPVAAPGARIAARAGLALALPLGVWWGVFPPAERAAVTNAAVGVLRRVQEVPRGT